MHHTEDLIVTVYCISDAPFCTDLLFLAVFFSLIDASSSNGRRATQPFCKQSLSKELRHWPSHGISALQSQAPVIALL